VKISSTYHVSKVVCFRVTTKNKVGFVKYWFRVKIPVVPYYLFFLVIFISAEHFFIFDQPKVPTRSNVLAETTPEVEN